MLGAVSPRIRTGFRDKAAPSIPLKRIRSLWRSEGFHIEESDEVDQSRSSLWHAFDSSVDWDSSAATTSILRVYESTLVELKELNPTNFDQLVKILNIDGLVVNQAGGLSWIGSLQAELSGLQSLRNASGIREAFSRIQDSIDKDPGETVGHVKDLIEATAKTVLANLDEGLVSNSDFPQLIKLAQNALDLDPKAQDDSNGTTKKVARLLGSLSNIAITINELRNIQGSGHGRVERHSLDSSHGQLAFNAGRAWCEMVLSTFEKRA